MFSLTNIHYASAAANAVGEEAPIRLDESPRLRSIAESPSPPPSHREDRMAKLLYVEASPRKARSASSAVAQAFLDAYRTARPGDAIDSWDVWAEPLPEFNGATLDAKYAVLSGANHTAEQAAAWDEVRRLASRFSSADRHLISLPMWNFGVPYKLKQLVDVITQPGLTFSFSPQTGYKGLVAGKPAVVIYARGGAYAPGSGAEALDLQRPYIETWLRFIGFTEVHAVEVEPTLGAPEQVSRGRTQALEAAVALAKKL
jgi:FMN-dependent NADH-azoreductase